MATLRVGQPLLRLLHHSKGNAKMNKLVPVLLAASMFWPISVSADSKNTDNSEMDCLFMRVSAESIPAHIYYLESHLRHPDSDPNDEITRTNHRESVNKYIAETNKRMPLCKDEQLVNYASARISEAKVIFARYDSKAWQTPMNLALQQYTRCAIDYFGKELGAQCQTRQEKLIKDKVAWEQTDSK